MLFGLVGDCSPVFVYSDIILYPNFSTNVSNVFLPILCKELPLNHKYLSVHLSIVTCFGWFICSADKFTLISTIEPFLGDERKINLDLLVFGVVQRLNAQKWLTRN